MSFDLESLYPVPSPGDGGERSFQNDIRRMNAATVAAEYDSARLRLCFETDMMNRLWLRRRLILLSARRAA